MSNASYKPAALPPPGAVSDFNAPDTLWKWNVLCQIMCLSITTILVPLRMYTKSMVMRRVGWEDCMGSLFLTLRIYQQLIRG